MASQPETAPLSSASSSLDDALDDTFPASDPPSQTDPTHGIRSGQGDDEDLIRQRAYDLWEKAGRPDGSDREHWEQARREIQSGSD